MREEGRGVRREGGRLVTPLTARLFDSDSRISWSWYLAVGMA